MSWVSEGLVNPEVVVGAVSRCVASQMDPHELDGVTCAQAGGGHHPAVGQEGPGTS